MTSPTCPTEPPQIPAWVCQPSYSGLCLGAAVPAAARACGFSVPGQPGEWTGPTGPHSAIVLVLADGLGDEQLSERAGHAPFLSRRERLVMRTGFPSTTAASLATLGTGLPPGTTGMAGYSLRDPATGQRTTLIGWETPTPPEVWQPHPTHFERLTQIGVPCVFVGQKRFGNSALTAATLRGTRFIAANPPADRVEAAARAAAAEPSVVYLYWGELDKAGHAHGWRSGAWANALEQFDGAMADLRRALPKSVGLWVTADHGMVDIDQEATADVATRPELAAGVDMVAGEPRAVHLYGKDPSGIVRRWREALGEAAWVLTKGEAIELGLFGDVEPRVAPMLGDVIVALAGRGAVVDSRTAAPAALGMLGHHGSLTPPEMQVPLIPIPPT